MKPPCCKSSLLISVGSRLSYQILSYFLFYEVTDCPFDSSLDGFQVWCTYACWEKGLDSDLSLIIYYQQFRENSLQILKHVGEGRNL